jgi:hypothetical protein
MALAVIVAAAAIFIGWHLSRAHLAHRGIPVRRGQLRSFRGDRTHHLIRLALLAVLLLVVIFLAGLH